MNLLYQLAILKKGNSIVVDSFHKFTNLASTLVIVDQALNDFELVLSLLESLWPRFDSFFTSITTHVEPISLEDISSHLLKNFASSNINPVLTSL